jgi:murein DD-endopeptidase MepM/ murein hydrolase activator NlpD
VAHPLPGGTIKNGWYDPRSRRTRLHVGTDIRASARTPILSTTDGTVLYVGFMPIPGNFVIVVDPFGYEYHYYHMYEISTFVSEGDTVKQGQQIGRVGSTGNSVAYHLHLGLVSPDGRYLNPYDLFVQAGIGPIQSD